MLFTLVVKDRRFETAAQYKNREKKSAYFRSVMLGAKASDTRLIDLEKSHFLRLKSVALSSAIHGLAIMHNCRYRDLTAGVDRLKQLKTLLQEGKSILLSHTVTILECSPSPSTEKRPW